MQAYTHVTVIDSTGGPSAPDRTVLVEDGVITAVGRTAEVPVPETASVVDLTGKYLIPGLADMHVHSDIEDERIIPALYLANGVTTVREMWGGPRVHDWRRRIGAGTMSGPRWVVGGNLVDGSPSLWEDIPGPAAPTVVKGAQDARRAVGETRDAGADFVKVYSRLDRESYLALMEEARRQDIPVVGHRSDLVPFVEQVELGQRSFEHVHGLWPALSRDAAEMEASMARISLEPDTYYSSWFRQINEVEWESVNSYDSAAAASVFGRLAANDVALCPTLVMHEKVDLPERAGLEDPRLRYLPPYMREMWKYVLEQVYTRGRSAAEGALRRDLFERRRETVVAMDAAGVRLLAGTDPLTPGVLPGFGLHDELELLVRSGLSPARVLRIATLEAARFLGREQWSGTVREGRAADLVVLDADPLADIRNTTRIHAVVVAGRFIGPGERQALLDTAERAAADQVA
ncbi:amidohydrolase family protein [Nocardiopsis tropica]|uniref:Amidohydrolase family protein n=1 Tax=Streptomonospora nanhaiensis TaxID=1323731 RepID=A0ABY6YMF8_9ACTN|nr:amidohydrolase family protein [Streptomonospora nanhaiensis]WAE73235.1 amidohydrolase family protein [Streptomonospora nanhaiensis]